MHCCPPPQWRPQTAWGWEAREGYLLGVGSRKVRSQQTRPPTQRTWYQHQGLDAIMDNPSCSHSDPRHPRPQQMWLAQP